MSHSVGDLQVWWIPQIGNMGGAKEFTVPVSSIAEGAKIAEVLADYDLYQFHNNIKPDYVNDGGVQRWVKDCDGDGNPGWEDVDLDDCSETENRDDRAHSIGMLAMVGRVVLGMDQQTAIEKATATIDKTTPATAQGE